MNKQTNNIGVIGSGSRLFSDKDGNQHQYFPISNAKSIEIQNAYEERMALLLGEPKPVNIFKKIYRYIKFEFASIAQAKVTKQIFEQRKQSCLSCPARIQTLTDSIGFCNLCGCGTNPRAALSIKLTIAGATCPMSKWYPVKTKFSFKNIPETCLGICVTVWYNVSRLWKRN